jgi:hypothetical protein
MKSDNLLVIVAVIAVVSSMVGLLITYNSVSHTKDLITGFAELETGFVNITIQNIALVEIISAAGFADNKTLNWGNGFVNSGDYAYLVSNGTVEGGTWGVIGEGFIVRNSGNQNVSIGINATNDSLTLFGAESEFKFSVFNLPGNDSCIDYTVTQGVYYDLNTSEDTIFCNNFGTAANNRLIGIDILLKIPASAPPGTRDINVILSYQSI